MLDLTYSKLITLETVRHVALIPNLTSLFLICRQLDPLESLKLILPHQRTLRRIGLSFLDFNISETQMEHLLTLLQAWEGRTALQHFHFGFWHEREVQSQHILRLIDILPNIKSIGGNCQLAGRLAELTLVSSRAEMDLALTKASDRRLELVLGALIDLPQDIRLSDTLTYMRFDTDLGETFGSRNLDILIQAIVMCQKLKHLSLADASGLEKTHAELLLASLPNLTFISLMNHAKDTIRSGTFYLAHPKLAQIPDLEIHGCTRIVPVWLPSLRQTSFNPSSGISNYTSVSPFVRELQINAETEENSNLTEATREALGFLAPSLNYLWTDAKVELWKLSHSYCTLHAVNLTDCRLKSDELNALMSTCPLLTTFLVRMRSEMDFDGDVLSNMYDIAWLKHKRLRGISLENIFFSETDFELLFDDSSLPALTSLYMNSIRQVSRITVHRLRNLRRFTSLYVQAFVPIDLTFSDCPSLHKALFIKSGCPLGQVKIVNSPKLAAVAVEF